MSVDHRYLWSTPFVVQHLRAGSLSEAAAFNYFLAIMTFDWLQFTLIATTPTPRITVWSATSSWVSFAVTVLGLLYLYRKNGGGGGKQFLHRYFPLSVTVGWKFVAAMFLALWLIPTVLVGASDPMLGWSATIALALINLVMFWRIGMHLATLAREGGDSLLE